MSEQLVTVTNDKGVSIKLPAVPLHGHTWHIKSYIDEFVDTAIHQHDLNLVNQEDGSFTLSQNILFEGNVPNDNDILYAARQIVEFAKKLGDRRETALAGYYN